MRVCFVVSNPFALNAFLAQPIAELAAKGAQVTVAVNTAEGAIAPTILRDAVIVPVAVARQIAPLDDLLALWRLWRLFRQSRFDLVHSVTPKAGLLAMLAARGAGVPVRLHTFTGQVWATRQGPMRWLLRAMDKVLASCTTAILVDSNSQREFLAAEGVAALPRLHVLGQGSICGVDTERFVPDAGAREQVRNTLGIAQDATMVLFVGRLHPEKGLAELVGAFRLLAQSDPSVHLVLAGPDEGGLNLPPGLDASVAARIHAVGHTATPERYMAAADIFCLPSYREGFGLSLIEAAAAGLPCVASRIYGITDAVVDGETGLLVPVRDTNALAQAIATLVADPGLRLQMAGAARQRAVSAFSRQSVMKEWLRFYEAQAK